MCHVLNVLSLQTFTFAPWIAEVWHTDQINLLEKIKDISSKKLQHLLNNNNYNKMKTL